MNRETIINELKRRGFKAVAHNVVKNGIELEGISIEDKLPLAPVIYFEDILHKLQSEEMSFEEIIDEIIDFINNYDFSFNPEDITNRNYILEGILMGVQRKGTENIVKKPVDELKGIESYLYIRKKTLSNQIFYIKISKEILENAEIEEEEAWKKAEVNTFAETQIFPMSSIIVSLSEKEKIDICDKSEKMYILTNKIKAKGASAILNKKVLSEFAEKFNTDKIIAIPSSIHEFIIMPYNNDTNIEEINKIINEVNSIEVEPTEQLGDCAYIINIFD